MIPSSIWTHMIDGNVLRRFIDTVVEFIGFSLYLEACIV